MTPRLVRIGLAALVTAVFAGACLWGAVTLISVCGVALGGFLAVAFAVLIVLAATGRNAVLWALFNVDDPLGWLAFLPPLWRWALRDDRHPAWR